MDKLMMYEKCPPVLGVVTSRANRMSTLDYSVVPTRQIEDEIASKLKEWRDIYHENERPGLFYGGKRIRRGVSFEDVFLFPISLSACIDYLVCHRQVSTNSFWTARMLIAASFPWMSIAIWFIPIALGWQLGSYELYYSIVLTLLGLYLAFRLDEGLENVEFRPALRSMIWLAFAEAWITYIGFSFHVSDDFFIAPE